MEAPHWLLFANSDFGTPGKIVILLGVNIFTNILLQSWWDSPQGTPVALESCFSWILCGKSYTASLSVSIIAVRYTCLTNEDEFLVSFLMVVSLC